MIKSHTYWDSRRDDFAMVKQTGWTGWTEDTISSVSNRHATSYPL